MVGLRRSRRLADSGGRLISVIVAIAVCLIACSGGGVVRAAFPGMTTLSNAVWRFDLTVVLGRGGGGSSLLADVLSATASIRHVALLTPLTEDGIAVAAHPMGVQRYVLGELRARIGTDLFWNESGLIGSRSVAQPNPIKCE